MSEYTRFGPADGPCLAVCSHCPFRKTNIGKSHEFVFDWPGNMRPYTAEFARKFANGFPPKDHECNRNRAGAEKRRFGSEKLCAGHILTHYKQTGHWPTGKENPSKMMGLDPLPLPAVMVTNPDDIGIPPPEKENKL